MSKLAKKLTLAEKLLEVQKAVGNIEKKGYNSFQRYAFAREADIAEAFQKLFNKHGIIMVTEECTPVSIQDIGDPKKFQKLTTIVAKFKLINSENSSDYYVYQEIGCGTDNGDKGIYKARTGAQKYFLLKNFNVSTGDDPENDTKSTSPNPRAGTKLAVGTVGGDF